MIKNSKRLICLAVFLLSFLISRNTYAMNGYIINEEMTHTDTIVNYSYTNVVKGLDCQKPDVLILRTFLLKDGEDIDENREYAWKIHGNGSVDIKGSFNIKEDGNYAVVIVGVGYSGPGAESRRMIYSSMGSFTIGNVPYQSPYYKEKAYWEGTVATYTEYDYMDPTGYVFDLYKDGVKVDSINSTSSSCDMAEVMAKYGTGNYRFILNADTYMGTMSMDTLSRVYKYAAENSEIYNVTINKDESGEATADPESGESGTTVKITATPGNGYRFKEWDVIEGDVNLADKTKAETTFIIKNSDVEIKACFVKEDEASSKSEESEKSSDPQSQEKKDDEKDEHHSDHTPASWEKNPNEKQQLVISCVGMGTGFSAGYQEQGEIAKGIIRSAIPAGWKEAFSFNLLVNGKTDTSLKKGTLTLTIPTEYLNTIVSAGQAGRQFAIVAMDKNGKTYLLTDTDTNPNTITANVAFEGYAMELIYK